MKPSTGHPVLRTHEPWPGPPQQARSVARRSQLLRAGRVLFGEKGFEATSIAEITTRAETAAGAFYIYFRSKKQLLVALMNEFIERLAALDLRPQAQGNARAGLRSFLAAAFRIDAQYYGVVRAWQEASLTDPELGRMAAAIQAWTEARIGRVFHLLQQHPHARKDCDLETFARMIEPALLVVAGAGIAAIAKRV